MIIITILNSCNQNSGKTSDTNDSKVGLANINQYNKIADRMYNKYGPPRDGFFIAKSSAKDFKFNLKNVSYYIEVQKLTTKNSNDYI